MGGPQGKVCIEPGRVILTFFVRCQEIAHIFWDTLYLKLEDLVNPALRLRLWLLNPHQLLLYKMVQHNPQETSNKFFALSDFHQIITSKYSLVGRSSGIYWQLEQLRFLGNDWATNSKKSVIMLQQTVGIFISRRCYYRNICRNIVSKRSSRIR